MIITKPGKYRLTKPISCFTLCEIVKLPVGKIVEITQIDHQYHKIIGPKLPDWIYWDAPLEKIE